VTSSRILLAAGTVAAALASVGPVVAHGSNGAAALRLEPGTKVEVVVPAAAQLLRGKVSGSPALAKRTHVTVVRASDGATVFTGSLATLRSLGVKPGTRLVVRVDRPAGFAGLRAASALSWS
jgi:hypothetical protein